LSPHFHNVTLPPPRCPPGSSSPYPQVRGVQTVPPPVLGWGAPWLSQHFLLNGSVPPPPPPPPPPAIPLGVPYPAGLQNWRPTSFGQWRKEDEVCWDSPSPYHLVILWLRRLEAHRIFPQWGVWWFPYPRVGIMERGCPCTKLSLPALSWVGPPVFNFCPNPMSGPIGVLPCPQGPVLGGAWKVQESLGQ